MRLFLVTLTALFCLAGEAVAQNKHVISATELAVDPAKFDGDFVKIRGMQCSTPGNGGDTLCVKLLPGRLLRVSGGSIGSRMPQETLEYLVERCTGTANIRSSACKFDIEITVETYRSGMVGDAISNEPLTQIFSHTIDLYR